MKEYDKIRKFKKQPKKLCLVAWSCPTLCNPMDCSPPGSSVHGDSQGKNTGVGCHALLKGIFLTRGLNPGLLHCRQIVQCLSHQGNPWILEWVACPFSRGTSLPRNWTRVSCIAGGFFTNWATREAPYFSYMCLNSEYAVWIYNDRIINYPLKK